VLHRRFFMPVAAISTTLVVPWLQHHRVILAGQPLVAIGNRSYGVNL
jgi:hypothetical protein